MAISELDKKRRKFVSKKVQFETSWEQRKSAFLLALKTKSFK